MGICQDPRLTYLNSSGFNVVRLPRQGIVPLGIIGRDHKSNTWLGTLDQIWKSTLPVPVPGAPLAVGALKGAKTSDIKISFGLDILANALSGMFGGSAPSLDTTYRDAKSVQFVFRDVRSIKIDPFLVGNFLAQGDLASKSPFVKRFFGGQKDVSALVITETLESKSIGVIGKKDGGTEVTINVPQLQGALGAKVTVSAANSASTEITYEGSAHLTFGYSAFGIGIVNGEWQIYGVNPNQDLAFAVGNVSPKPIVDSGELVDLMELAQGVGVTAH